MRSDKKIMRTKVLERPKLQKIMRKQVISIALALSLLTSVTVYMKGVEAQDISFIDIDPEDFGFLSGINEFPFGITCDDPNFVYVTSCAWSFICDGYSRS